MSKTKNYLLFIFSIITAFLLGIIFSEKIRTYFNKNYTNDYSKTERRETGFTFINPLLECEFTNSQGNISLKSIKKTIEKIVKITQMNLSVFIIEICLMVHGMELMKMPILPLKVY